MCTHESRWDANPMLLNWQRSVLKREATHKKKSGYALYYRCYYMPAVAGYRRRRVYSDRSFSQLKICIHCIYVFVYTYDI